MDAPKRAPKRKRTCDEPHNDRTFDSDWVWEWAKGFACEVDTSKPCILAALCDVLKTSSVTEIDVSSGGLGPPAIEILSDYVRDATAALAVLNISGAFTPFTSSPHSLQCSSPLHPIQQFTPFTSSP